MIIRPHVCDDRCVCPVHGTPLLYWPAGDEHACQDPDCGHVHGTGALDELGPRLVAMFANEEALSLWGRGNPPGPDAHPAFTFAPRFTGVLGYLEDRHG